MIDFSSQTYANILARQLNRIPNTIDKRSTSMVTTALGPESWAIEGIYLSLEQIQNNGFITTATGDSLDLLAETRGIYRSQPTAAVREGIFNISVPVGFRASTIDGENSISFVSTSVAVRQDDGTWTANLTAEVTGSVGNAYTGNLLPITFVAGLTRAQIGAIILAGTDEEDDESLRNRYLLSLAEQPFAGNIAAYRQACLEEDTVGAVQVWPHWQGAGTVMCSILDANFDLATDTLIEQIQIKICPPDVTSEDPSRLGFGLAPVGALVTIQTGTAQNVNVEFNVELAPGQTLPNIRAEIEQAIEDYMLSVRRTWGNPLTRNEISYPVIVYISKINVAILNVEGVVNVTGTTLNGSDTDLVLTESTTTQQVPFVGTVTINVI